MPIACFTTKNYPDSAIYQAHLGAFVAAIARAYASGAPLSGTLPERADWTNSDVASGGCNMGLSDDVAATSFGPSDYMEIRLPDSDDYIPILSKDEAAYRNPVKKAL